MNVERISCEPGDGRNGNVYYNYFIDRCAWIWDEKTTDCDVLEFKNEFALDDDATFTFQVSADNRYELFLDGKYVGMGPDRCDVMHWSFATYKVSLEKGAHVFSAKCFSFPQLPDAQTTFENGFIFACDDENLQSVLNTGRGNWLCRRYSGVSFSGNSDPERKVNVSTVLTPTPIFNAKEFFNPSGYVKATVTRNYSPESRGGARSTIRKFCPSNLPDQILAEADVKNAEARACFEGSSGTGEIVTEEMTKSPRLDDWTHLFSEGKPVTVKAGEKYAVIIDLKDYYCAYPEPVISGGSEDSVLNVAWTEALNKVDPALLDKPSELQSEFTKGDRSGLIGKMPLYLMADRFTGFDGKRHSFKSFWWKAGRFLLIYVYGGKAGFTVEKLALTESRYPLSLQSGIVTSDETLNGMIPMMVRSMQMCSHETFMDCPFYEQLMYVGDTRMECLTNYVMMQDARLPYRAVDTFNNSRAEWDDLVSEHYPSRIPQLSSTFSMIWPLMVKDVIMYRGIPSQTWLNGVRNGVRNLINALTEYLNCDDLLENLPGWQFVDWVPEWKFEDDGKLAWGVPPPCFNNGASSIFTLHFAGALLAASFLETLPGGSDFLKRHFDDLKKKIDEALYAKFFVKEKGFFADDPARTRFSAHAQCLALLYDVVKERGEDAELFANLLAAKDVAMPTVYFSFYLFETLQKYGHGGDVADRLDIWQNMLGNGACTTWEAPEPSRSDCHAWGAHPLYHYFSSIAGIRPAAPAFKRVSVAPSLGRLNGISGSLVHPDGKIDFEFVKEGDALKGFVTLPDGVDGTLTLPDGREISLSAGTSRF